VSKTFQSLHGLLEGGYRLLSINRRKGAQEVVEAVPAREVIEQVLNGNPGADEHRHASEDLRVAMDRRVSSGHRCLSGSKCIWNV
jgi:hypothetical protein